jgi:hypothetical protein
MAITKFETEGGLVTRGITYAKMLDQFRELQDTILTMGHLHQTEDNDMDRLLAQGWRGVAEMLRMIEHKVTEMAMRKMH